MCAMWKIRLGGALDLSFVCGCCREGAALVTQLRIPPLGFGTVSAAPSGTAPCEVSALLFLDSCCMINTFLAPMLYQHKGSFIDVIYYSQFIEIILCC